MGNGDRVRIISFSNESRQDKKRLKEFVNFHWHHYRGDSGYVPLLNYEYTGFKPLGIKGFFETDNFFFSHAEMRFFMAYRGDQAVGRCNAFINRNHNAYWNDRIAFFGHFESVNDTEVAGALIRAAEAWLKGRNMDTLRGPQNFPVNDATPGVMTAGFETRPVIYYHYNKPYYEALLLEAGFKPVKKVFSWEVDVRNPMEAKLVRVAGEVMDRYRIKVETWGERPFKERKREMLEIYNGAWSDNFGFVPFTPEEFYRLMDDVQMILDKGLFLFLYMKEEPVGFFGAVPNILENMVPWKFCRRCELIRALRMLLLKDRTKGFRVGYLGVKKEHRGLGLDGLMLWKQKTYAQKKGYEYCDIGWVLEDNVKTISLVKMMGARLSKTYVIMEKPIS
jgi:hypothetical protein